MEIDSEELETYVKEVAESLKTGLGEAEVGENYDARLAGSIDFEVEVINKKTKEGGVKLKVAEAGGDSKQKATSRVSFSVSLNNTEAAVGAV